MLGIPSRSSYGQPKVERAWSLHTSQAKVLSDGNVEGDDGLSVYVSDKAGVFIAIPGEDF